MRVCLSAVVVFIVGSAHRLQSPPSAMPGTKHVRRSSQDTAAQASVARPVPLPQKNLVAELNAVVLGAREPEEGRYSTVSRQNYLHGQQKAKAGEAGAHPPTRSELQHVKDKQSQFMRDKNFLFGYEGRDGPIVSESRAAQMSSVALGQGARRSSAGRAATPMLPGDATPELLTTNEIKANNDRMRTSHVFDGPLAQRRALSAMGQLPPDSSTSRVSYVECDANDAAQQRKQAAVCRRVQQSTSWTLGTAKDDWKSEKETKMTGKMVERAPLATSNLGTYVPMSDSTVDIKDSLRSLKSVDFVPHKAAAVQPTAFSSHEHHCTFGYLPKDLNSTNRTSFSPTEYVVDEATAARVQLSRGIHDGNLPSPNRSRGGFTGAPATGEAAAVARATVEAGLARQAHQREAALRVFHTGMVKPMRERTDGSLQR